ncbi:AAA family ATPase [Bradyrhizobium sp. 41S5]|uniref:bifunctional aminoglycoside phosphotransferase/ATP-binding protein n=1 Tax=Bradyrhizobium sp. 41S5 TaxID=1404443 RepID=UPI00156BACDD|nr:bifunctional aminoglycoside phosphotransferase/ATP-binding protein [Bradyrhizobium sp. 41S5]UFX45746.1 AAA family ATPase [Bradyrhizobium sp. 41S5]
MTTPISTPDAATGETDQAAVLSFLAGSGRSNAPVKRIDTHCSIVFLEPSRVLKIKRAVKLPYLDFSTLEKRQHACEDEIAINKRNAPAIYHRVVPITRGRDGLAVGGTGPVVEWAVEMARFDENKTLDHLAEQDAIRPELGERLAAILLESHRTATGREGSPWLASLPVIIDRNTEQFCAGSVLSREEIDRLHELSHQALARNLELLRRRAAAGQVRHCHGDAHLGNIVLLDGQPVLFDAIEFDPNIATTDVLYDLAFPVMDLLYFGQEPTANRLFNSYVQATWDAQSNALSLLPLFLSMRAGIRANVLFTKRRQYQSDQTITAHAERYFQLARRLIEPGPPRLLAIGGKSGTGKSVLARDIAHLIAPPPGALVLRSDVIRKQLNQVAEHATLPPETYTPEASDRVYQAMLDRAGHALAQGISVILDAAFLQQAERDAAKVVARGAKVEFSGIFLTADDAARRQRVASRRHDASDATLDVVNAQAKINTGDVDWEIVDASGSPATTLHRSMSCLRNAPCPSGMRTAP